MFKSDLSWADLKAGFFVITELYNHGTGGLKRLKMPLNAQLSCFILFLSTALMAVPSNADDAVCPGGDVRTAADGDYDAFEGRRIAAIKYRTIPVFNPDDPRENNAFYRALNHIHVDTRDNVIAGQLLFAEGDTLRPNSLAETERLLRTRSYLNNARIRVVGECPDGGVVLLVTVRDVWTFDPQVSFGREGGETKYGFGLSEGNLLGTGNSLFIGYDKNADRSSIDYGFYSPHLFNTRLSAKLGFADTSDGQQSVFELSQPFYSLQAPWAAGLRNESLSFIETVRYQDDVINAYKHQRAHHETFVGVAFDVSANHTQRLLLGLTQDKQEFTANEDTLQSVPSDFNHVFPWLEYRFIENKYAVYTNFNQMHQVEDVSIGADLRVRLGHGGGYWGNKADVTRLEVGYADMIDLGGNHLMRLHLSADGRYLSGAAEQGEAVLGGHLGYYSLIGEKHRWYISGSYHQGHQLSQHLELTAGGGGGLRGYPLDYQRGDKRYLASIEKRYISDLHLFNVLRFGTAMYIDIGRAWGGGYYNAPHLANFGVGIRMSSSKAKVGNILHLDLAFPLVERDQVNSFQWVIRASQSL